MSGGKNWNPSFTRFITWQSIGQVQRFCKMCEASLPDELLGELEKTEPKEQSTIGTRWSKHQVKELGNRTKNAPGFHLYALNQSEASLEILEWLKT